MSNSVELAPMANIEEADAEHVETRLLNRGVANTNMEGIDDGLISSPRIPPTNNGVDHEVSPTPYVPPKEYPAPRGRRPLDVNLYATKKTVAQGMMDLALLTANANQLRYVLESGNSGPYFYFSVTLISLSIILQLVIGMVLICLGRYNMTHMDQGYKAEKLNNIVVLLVFLITSVNVFISAFGIDPVEKMDPVLIVDAALHSLKQREFAETTTLL